MKKITVLLLVALLAMPIALAEESFFTEESFNAEGRNLSEDSFFMESSFSAEDDLFKEVTEEADLLEEKLEEEELEDRSLLLLATDSESNYPYPAPKYTFKSGYYPGNPYKLKPGEVKLTWEQKDSGGKVIKKLAKGWKWVIYETETQNGVWLQVATSTKPTITLKNQPVGYKMYIVRPEYKSGNEESYAEHTGSGLQGWNFYDANAVYVQASNLWKTIDTLSVRPDINISYQTINYSFTTQDNAAALGDGSEVRYTVCLYGYNAGKKSLVFPGSISDPPLKIQGNEKFKNSYRVFDHSHGINITAQVAAGFTKFELQVTPVVWKDGKITQTGKTKKATVIVTPEKDRWKTMAPVISLVQRESYNSVCVYWDHGPWTDWSETPDYYEVYDGNKLVATADGGSPTDSRHEAYILMPAPGKHKFTVRACSWDKKVRGKTSAVYTFEIPKENKDVPLIQYAFVTKGSGNTDSVTLSWSNPNPLLTGFEVVVIPLQLSSFNNRDDYWAEVSYEGVYGSAHYNKWNITSSYLTIYDVLNGTDHGSRQSYLICVVGYTPDYKQPFISDPIFARYNSSTGNYSYENVKLKRK